jgi:hypothetical protein
MPEYSRRDVLGGIAGGITASVAGCQSGEEEHDPLSEVIHNIEYSQRDNVEDYNKHGNRIRDVFEEESMQYLPEPENVDETTGTIDYTIDLHTAKEGTLADMHNPERMEGEPALDERDQTEYHTKRLLGNMFLTQFILPIQGINGNGLKDRETHEEYRERLGSIDAHVEDYSGNTATLEMPEETVEDFWKQVENDLENDTEQAIDELIDYCEENLEYSFERAEN